MFLRNSTIYLQDLITPRTGSQMRPMNLCGTTRFVRWLSRAIKINAVYCEFGIVEDELSMKKRKIEIKFD